MQIANGIYCALTTSMEAYFLGDEKKTPDELDASRAITSVTLLDDDRRGTVEMKYVHPIPLRAKPLTALDLCFSGEHEEVAAVSPSKRLSFIPTNAAAAMYYEVTITSLAKRNGGATFGFSLEKPYSMPGASWYTFGYSIDSGIIRNGIGIPPVKNLNNGKKPRVGDVWGAGYMVHLSEEPFLDDSKTWRPRGSPRSTSFFVTLNGQIKYRIYVHSTPLMMQPTAMLANTGDGLLFNFAGDALHPFCFDIKELQKLERPAGLEGMRLNFEIMIGPNIRPAPPEHRLPPIAHPQYIPLAKKCLQMSEEELSTFGMDRFATIVGSYRNLAKVDEFVGSRLPFSVAQDIVDLDISCYYHDLCHALQPDEAKNILLHLSPKLTPEEQLALLNSENPQDQLRRLSGELILQRALTVYLDFEAYIRNFSALPKLLDRTEGRPTPHPSSAPWVPTLFHPDFPFPLSMETHRYLRAARALTDSVTHNLGGIYNNATVNLETVLQHGMAQALKMACEEIAWAESQIRKLILGLPTTMPPRWFSLSSSPPECIAISASYICFFDIITILDDVGLIAVTTAAFPTQEKVEKWMLGKDPMWLELFVWNAFVSIPLTPDLDIEASTPAIPETVPEAFQAVMQLVGRERKRLGSKPLDRAHVGALQGHASAISSIIAQCDRNTILSTRGMDNFINRAQIARLAPLPQTTDPPIPCTPEIRVHGYKFASTQIQQLHYLFGRHPLLAPLLDWLENDSNNLIALAMDDLNRLRKDVLASATAQYDKPMLNEDELHRTHGPSGRVLFGSVQRRVRPAAIAIFGIATAAIVGAAGYLGYKIFRAKARS